MADYLDPVVASIVGDISDLLAKIAEAQGAMGEFAGTAPAMEFNPESMAVGVDQAVAAAEELGNAEAEAAMSAEELEAAIEATGGLSAEEYAQMTAETEALTAATGELSAELEQLDAELGQTVIELEALSESADQAAASETAAGDAAKDSGDKAKEASTNWMMLALAGAAVEVGIGGGVLALSAAMVGIGYLISDFGGTATGDLQQVESAFRSTAEQASQAFGPALQEITQNLEDMAHSVEPVMAEMFAALSGPAESFFQGLAASAEQGMDALLPAIEQMGPLIASITEDLGPLFTGIAGFIQQMAAAFEAGGGQQELAQLAQEIGQLLPPLGQLVGELGAGLLPVMEALTPVLTAAADILDALGPHAATAAAAAYLLYQGWQLLDNASGALLSGFDKLGTFLATLTGEQEGTAGTAAEASAALVAEGAAADEAALGFAALAVEMLPLIVSAAAVGLAAYELIEHWQAVEQFFENLVGDMFSFGENIVDGLASGIEDAWNTVMAPINALINGIKGAFTSLLGIASPSTVTREYGLNLGQGFALGMGDAEGLVHTAAGSLSGQALTGLSASAAGAGLYGAAGSAPIAGGGSQGASQVNIYITQPLGTPAEIEAAIMPVIQQLNLRNGQSMTNVAVGGRT